MIFLPIYSWFSLDLSPKFPQTNVKMAHDLYRVIERPTLAPECCLRVFYVSFGKKTFGGVPSNVHSSQGVFESGMLRTWIDQMRTRQLPDSPQTLEHNTVKQFLFNFSEADMSMNRISYFSCKLHATLLSHCLCKAQN